MPELKAESVGCAADGDYRKSLDSGGGNLARVDCRQSMDSGRNTERSRMSNALLEQKYVEFPTKKIVGIREVDLTNKTLGSSLGRKIFAGQTLASFEDSLYMLPDENEHWLLGHKFFVGTVNTAIVASGIHMGVIHEVDPDVEGPVKDLLHAFENFFAAIFTVEMFVKLAILKHNYFCDKETRGWNAMDFVIGVVSIIDCWILPLFFLKGASSSPVSVVRIFRLLRLLRILKFLRHVPELMMVMEGMFAAMKAMGWIVLLLAGLVYILSIICVEIIGYAGSDIYPAFSKDSADMESDVVVDWNSYLYFGTMVRSLISLFSMMLLSEWSLLVRPVFERQPFMVLCFACLIFVTTFGIFNVMIGVVVERTNEAMAREKMQNENERSRTRVGLIKDLAHLMFQQDQDGDGKLSLPEMYGLTGEARFKELLAMIDLPFGFDVECLFMMFDDHGSGELSEEDFVLGMLRLLDGSHFQQACIQQLMIARMRRTVLGMRSIIEESVSTEISSLRAELTTLFVALQSKADAADSSMVESVMAPTTKARLHDAPSLRTPTVKPNLKARRPRIVVEKGCKASPSAEEQPDAAVGLRLAAGMAEFSDGSAETVALQNLWKRLGAIVQALEPPITEMAVLARGTSQCHSGAAVGLQPPGVHAGTASSSLDPGISKDPARSAGHHHATGHARESEEAPACQDASTSKPPSSDLSAPDRPTPWYR